MNSVQTRPQTTKPPSVDWWITSRCNLRCDFCYGPVPDMDPVDVRGQIAHAISSSPAAAVTFCGGEPLLVRELPAIARQQQDAGKLTVLNTNGELLRRRFHAVSELPFDIVGISIDGPNEKVHRQIRGSDANFVETLTASRWLAGGERSPRRKVGSVVSRVNESSMVELARLVREIAPDVWRIYQYSPWGPQNRGHLRHHLDDNDFQRVVDEATAACDPVPVQASPVRLTGGCLIVDPSGFVLKPEDRGYAVIGNCIEENLDDIWERSSQAVIRDNKHWIRHMDLR
jgi:MoaA/NifB/PqqE/SkfB family radical SAM enzyme